MTVLRSTAGFGFPLFAPAMYNALGYGWVSLRGWDRRGLMLMNDTGQLGVGICCYCYWSSGAVVLLDIRSGAQGEIAIRCWMKPQVVYDIASAVQKYYSWARTLGQGVVTKADTLRSLGVALASRLAQEQTA